MTYGLELTGIIDKCYQLLFKMDLTGKRIACDKILKSDAAKWKLCHLY